MNCYTKRIIVVTILIWLIITNPSQKTKYAQRLANRAHAIWCEGIKIEHGACEVIGRLSVPALERIIHRHTTSQNVGISTFFQTNTPCLDIYTVGIGGQYLSVPIPTQHPHRLCEFFPQLPDRGYLAVNDNRIH